MAEGNSLQPEATGAAIGRRNGRSLRYSGTQIGGRASAHAATRVNAEQASDLRTDLPTPRNLPIHGNLPALEAVLPISRVAK